MSNWNVFKTATARKMGQMQGWLKREFGGAPVDEHAPLDIHIGGRIAIDALPFLVAADKLKVKSPGKELNVIAYGKLSFEDFNVHHFYLEPTEQARPDSKADADAMLRFVYDSANELVECRLFCAHDQVFPQASADWDYWLSETEGAIGWSGFETKDDNTLYNRLWEGDGPDHVAPWRFTETVYLDRRGEDVAELALQAMMYGRMATEPQGEAEGIAEYALLQCEENNATHEASINILLGIDVTVDSIRIVF